MLTHSKPRIEMNLASLVRGNELSECGGSFGLSAQIRIFARTPGVILSPMCGNCTSPAFS